LREVCGEDAAFFDLQVALLGVERQYRGMSRRAGGFEAVEGKLRAGVDASEQGAGAGVAGREGGEGGGGARGGGGGGGEGGRGGNGSARGDADAMRVGPASRGLPRGKTSVPEDASARPKQNEPESAGLSGSPSRPGKGAGRCVTFSRPSCRLSCRPSWWGRP